MLKPLPAKDEKSRLCVLHDLKLLDTDPEERFDRLTRLVKRLFNVPICLISLVDADRQWFKSRQGLDAIETPRDVSFCGHAILGSEIFIVEDAAADPRFNDNPLVTGEPKIRFYAGRPLASPCGARVGTLCVIDRSPRAFTTEDIDMLDHLGELAAEELFSLRVSEALKQRTQELTEQAHWLQESRQQLQDEIKEREKAEQHALQLQAILDESSNEIYLFGEGDLRFQWVNKGAQKNLGYSEEEMLRMTPLDLKFDMNIEDFNRRIEPLCKGLKKELLFETFHTRADRTTYPVEVHLQFARDFPEPIFVAVAIDISERKRYENELIQSKKLESIGQLAAGIAHEINTPAQYVGDNVKFLDGVFKDILTILNAYRKMADAAQNAKPLSGALQDNLDKLATVTNELDEAYLVEEIPGAIKQSLDGIEKISEIVRATKEFSHPGNKEKEPVDLNKVIANAILISSNEWKYSATLETDFDESLPKVLCVTHEIGQAILNLIVNAAHAISVTRQDSADNKGKITITTRALPNKVEVLVSDTGGGVPDDIQDRIFDPFFTTKEVGKGTGQGLAIARSIVVEKHQGKLDLESANGDGATFRLQLPLSGLDPKAD